MRTQRIAGRLAIVIFLGTLLLGWSGCGVLLTQGPPNGHEGMDHFECTESVVASVIDLALTGLYVIGPLTSSNPDYDFLVWGAVTGASAVVGFHKTSECRAAKRAWAARQAQARSDTAKSPPVPSIVQAVVVTPAADTLTVGGLVQLFAEARASSGSVIPGRTFIWSSSNEAVASVSITGLVVGRASGSVVITARTHGVEGSASIVVVPAR